MTVWIDDMYKHPMGRCGRMKMSHMIATTEAELHAMANKIGLARRWYQGDHYDVAIGLRNKAIAAGAVPITLRQLAAVNQCLKQGIPFTTVEEAVENHRTRFREQLKAHPATPDQGTLPLQSEAPGE